MRKINQSQGKVWLAIGSACFALLFSNGCGKEQQAQLPPPVVRTQQVSAAQAAGTDYAGNVRGRYETGMAFQVGGQILSRNVQAGDRVQAGQVLMTIDPKDVAQKSRQGDAGVAAALAQLQLAEKNYQRYEELYRVEAVSALVRDQQRANYEAAQAAYENAAAEAAQGHNALGYTQLAATADGVIAKVNAEAGQVVGAGQNVLTLVQTDEYEVEINVPENHLDEVQVGRQTEVSFWALKEKGAAVPGVVREVSSVADSVSRTYRVRVSLPERPQGLALGMTANVRVAGREAAGIELPLSAIYQEGDEPQVWLVDKDTLTVSRRKVKVLSMGGNTVQVSGLKASDIVVTAGVHKLHDGEAVRLGAEAAKP